MITAKKIWFVFLLLAPKVMFCQELPDNTQQQLENLTELSEEEPDNDELLQQFFYLRKHPLNLNLATKEELQEFPFLTDHQISNLLQYRQLLGALIDVHELQSVPYWDLPTIYKLLPYITVTPTQKLKDDLKLQVSAGEHQLLVRSTRTLEKAKGFDRSITNGFLGDRNNLQLRYRYQYKQNLMYGFTADKDAGEPLFKEINRLGFDFYSVHIFRKGTGLMKSLALGDYTVNLGQGLIHWQSLAFKKSTEVLSVKRQSQSLKPYRAAGEFFFHRGVAATLAKQNWESTVFASSKKISGNIATGVSGDDIFTSFQASGLHRTRSEIADKHQIQQHSLGGNIKYSKKSFNIGLNGVYYKFSKPFQKREAPYNFFAWTGDEWVNASIDYGATIKNVHVFGEAALDKRFSRALVNGAMISVDPKVDLSFVHRYITKEYQALYGNALTESTQPNNEAGFFTGVVVRPFSTVKINGYVDFYKFPWLKYRVDGPSYGRDYLLQFTFQPTKTSEVYARFRNETKQLNEAVIEQPTHPLIARTRQSIRLHVSQNLSSKLLFRARSEMVWFGKKTAASEEGVLFFVDAQWRTQKSWNANLRLQYFETDGYNSRIYAYENDVLFSYSIPAFFNKGSRYYFNLNYDVGKVFSVWVRWAQTLYKDDASIGSGLNQINGKSRSDIRIQAIYRFL
ncbi:MAG TPA: helix-hairpin-helix domain-containing protein [Chitinophagaceae bacterium]|nr:helix-hairpin-helix domain-containing protein [Chitinophagaceae bacterium]